MDKILSTEDGYWCTGCKSLCTMYEQGLACDCDSRWITEVCDERKYPDKWIPVEIVIRRKDA
jgi:hypothetical protein